MIDKVYLVIELDHGYRSCGEYVTLYGIYVDEDEAEERMLELKQENRKTRGTRKIFEVIDVKFNENIEEQLGGYVI